MRNIDNSKKFYICANAYCPRRSIDATKLIEYLEKKNFKLTLNMKKADFIIIYTCGGFTNSEKRSLLTIEKALKNKFARVIVSGCLPSINPYVLEKYQTIKIVPPNDIIKMDEFSNFDTIDENNSYHWSNYSFSDLSLINTFNSFKNCFKYLILRFKSIRHYYEKLSSNDSFSPFSESTYKLEIGRGCLSKCSYCAIKFANTKFKSISEEKIICDFVNALSKGYKNFVLVASDIGCYGLDIKTNLPSLLNKLFSVDSNYRIFLSDLNSKWFLIYFQELLMILKANSKKISRILIPIQSGSNRLLKMMNREYNIGDVKRCLKILNSEIPELKLDTHIMIGFPGETESDFKDSLLLIEEIKFHKVDVYQYEDRPGTLASTFQSKIQKTVIKNRIKTLIKVAKKQKINLSIVHN